MLRFSSPRSSRSTAFLLGFVGLGIASAGVGCTGILGDFEVGADVGDGGSSEAAPSDGSSVDATPDAPPGDGGNVDGGDAGCVIPADGTLNDAVAVAAGQSHTCAIRANGSVYCWGDNAAGQLGVSQVTALSSPKPLKVEFPASAGAVTITQVACSEKTTFAVDTLRRLWAWGGNDNGLLAKGSVDNDAHPEPAIVQRAGTPFLVRNIAPEWYDACALSVTGEIDCWGTNNALNTGPDAPMGASYTPVKAFNFSAAPSPNALLARGVGSSATCYADGAAAGGELVCWGSQGGGYLLSNATFPPYGGVTYNAKAPLTAAGAKLPLQDIWYGTNFGAALDKEGKIFSWGVNNSSNQHGVSAPAAGAALQAPGKWRALAAGYVHWCGVDDKGTVRCRGSNTQSQLGRDTGGANGVEPLPVVDKTGKSLDSAIGVGSGFFHTCAIREGTCGPTGPGRVFCWGQGSMGQLGNGETSNSIAAVRVVAP